MKKIIAIIVAALLATLGVTAPAQADDRPKYTVTETGIQLPEGYKFEAHGHVNIKWVDEDGEHSAGMHFDPNNNQPGGYFIGKSFFPFSSLIKNFDKCPQVVWVQVHGWNYHYTATPDPDKCAAPPAEDDDSSNSDSQDDSDASVEGDKADEGDSSGSEDGDKANEGDSSGSKDGDKADEGSKDGSDAGQDGDKADEGSKDGDKSDDGDHDSEAIDDDNADTQADADGDKDGGEIPPTGISGMVLSIMLGAGLVVVGALTIANSRSKKSAKH